MRMIVLGGVALLSGVCAFAQRHAPAIPEEWKAALPAIQELAKKEFHNDAGPNPITIYETGDVTGDGKPEALIDLGCCGAYTDQMTVMRLEDGRPVLALFRGNEGKASPTTFVAGASVMHGADVKLLSDKEAVLTVHWDMSSDGKRVASCTGATYRWNGATKSFDLNKELSRSLSQDFCKDLSRRLARLK